MDLMQLILILVVVGVVMYIINKYVPMQATIKKVLNIAVVVCVIIFLIIVIFHIDIRHFGHIRI
jgi:hypothetical protein